MSSAAIVSLAGCGSPRRRGPRGSTGRGGGTPSACRDVRRWCCGCRAGSGSWTRAERAGEARDLDDVGRVPAARTLGVERMDGAAGLKAAIVSSTKPDSLRVSEWIITCTSNRSATDRQQSIALPASCPNPRAVSAHRPRPAPSPRAEPGQRGVALAGEGRYSSERLSAASIIRAMMPGSRRAGGGEGAVRRAGAAAQHRGYARASAPPRSAAGR